MRKMLRNTRSKVFCKKGVLKNLAKFTGKHLCQSLFFNKVTGCETYNFIKKEDLAQVFPCELAKFLRIAFFYRTIPGAAFHVTNVTSRLV